MVDGVWNCGEGRTNIDLVPSTNLFPRRGSLCDLTEGGTSDDRSGDVGCGDVMDRTISGLGCCRGGPGVAGDASGIREVEKLGVASGGELGIFFAGDGAGLGTGGSSNGRMTVGLGIPLGWGTTLSAAAPISGRSASSSLRICRSYMIDERTCSTRAAVMSSWASRLCRSSARCRFCEIPSALLARICSYLLAYDVR